MSTLYGESATDLFGSADIDLGEEEIAPKKRKMTKSVKAQDQEDRTQVDIDLIPYDWSIDDKHAPTSVNPKTLIDTLLPYYFLLRTYPVIESKLFHPDSSLMQQSGCAPKNLEASGLTPDSFFEELPDREDYTNDAEYSFALQHKKRERLTAKKQCFECPLQKVCAANSVISTFAIREAQIDVLSPIDYEDDIQAQMKKSKSDDPVIQREEAMRTKRIEKKLRGSYENRESDEYLNIMVGIFGGFTVYDRSLFVDEIDRQYKRYENGKRAVNEGIVETDDDFKQKLMMTRDEITTIEKRMNVLYSEYAQYTY